jgi:hypothetical protein
VNDVTQQMRRDLESFNRAHRPVLESTGAKLLKRGIVRVHYGVDYVNDDGAPADYAVLEYIDGRIEELDAWLEDLDGETFSWGVRYCYPYTFDARTAQVSFDASGGQIDTEENVIRMFHTPARRELLEVEAENAGRLEAFSGSHYDTLEGLCMILEQQEIRDLYFGVDETPRGHALSAWLFADKEDGSPEVLLEEASPISVRFREVMRDFPEEVGLIGAFSLNAVTCWVYNDPNGGTHVLNDGTVCAYHTAEQLENLEGAA